MGKIVISENVSLDSLRRHLPEASAVVEVVRAATGWTHAGFEATHDLALILDDDGSLESIDLGPSEALDAMVNATQQRVTGVVRLKLYKGNAMIAGRRSPFSMYDEALASFGEGARYDHADAAGFIRLFSLPTRVESRQREAAPSDADAAPARGRDDGRDVAIFLPSGRPIVYNDAQMVNDGARTSLAYHGARGIEHIYGGKIVENVIQAMCRDLLADAMVRAERAGLPVVLHVHDELVCEVPAAGAREASELLHAIMLHLPEWAEGFPIGADGHAGVRYRK